MVSCASLGPQTSLFYLGNSHKIKWVFSNVWKIQGVPRMAKNPQVQSEEHRGHVT